MVDNEDRKSLVRNIDRPNQASKSSFILQLLGVLSLVSGVISCLYFLIIAGDSSYKGMHAYFIWTAIGCLFAGLFTYAFVNVVNAIYDKIYSDK